MNVLIVESHPVYRKGLEAIFNQYFSQWQVETADDINNSVNILKHSKIKIDLLLFSINTPDENNNYPLEKILNDMGNMDDTAIIVLSSVADGLYLKKILDIGVRGIIPKLYTIEKMVNAIKECWKGNIHIPTEVRKVISQCLMQNEAISSLRLTKRQLQVLELIEKRMTNEEIADTLCVSLSTIKTHINKLYNTLEVGGRKDCVKRSYDLGLLPRSA